MPPLFAIVVVDLRAGQQLAMLARSAEEAEARAGPIPDNPLFRTYHYAIPPELSEQLVPGQLLWVPFGTEHRQGVLLGFSTEAPAATLRPLAAVAQAQPFLQPYQLELARWMSERYLAPLWDTLLLLLPPGVHQQSERVLRRTDRPVRVALAREARTALAWLETQGGSSPMAQLADVLGSQAAARRATSDLLGQRLVREVWRAKPPGVRPREERFVALLTPPDRWPAAFRRLGRPSPAALLLEALTSRGGTAPLSVLQQESGASDSVVSGLVAKGWVERLPGTFVQRAAAPNGTRTLTPAQAAALAWVEAWPRDESLPLLTMQAAGFRGPTVRALAARGLLTVHERGPEQLQGLLAPYRLPAVLDELRGTSIHRAVLTLLHQVGTEMTIGEVYRATGAERAHLEALAGAGLVAVTAREVRRNPLADRHFPPTVAPPFTQEQASVWQALEPAVCREGRGASEVFLLHGVTGSGKTEIFLRAVAETLARGKQAIVLVPEISLTPQAIARFASRFGEQVAVQHSQLSEGERFDEWRRLRDGQATIALGSRSALFAPVPNLGLIVVDEEHEGSYKQGHLPGYRFPHYHTRDVAAHLATLTGATVILGSATPALETYHRATEGRYRLLEMGRRVPISDLTDTAARPKGSDAVPLADGQASALHFVSTSALNHQSYVEIGNRAPSLSTSTSANSRPPKIENPMVPVEIVDMRQELRVGNTSIFSRALQGALAATLGAQQQAILFLNRRGAHAFVMCRDCGWVQQCPHCDVPMSSHRGADYLLCHQCSATVAVPTLCPHCLSQRVKHFGVGTQQVEEVAQALFPNARLLRWDRDTARGRGAHERLLTHFASGQADILIGTQMIAKGLDLPLVTLVGIISADTALHLPDFRSGERTFQLLTQVAGRAGRGALGGRAVLQTYTPLHYAIQAASHHDFATFYQHEIAFRREHAYPPFAPLVRLVYSDPSPRAAAEHAERLAERLRLRVTQLGLPATEVIGPAPCFFGRLRGKYRWQVLLRGPHARTLTRETPPGFGWEVDVDPVTTL